jgi:glycosyltransferase involved in cell wall biosynthesis
MGDPSATPAVSVLIRVRNESSALAEVLQRLALQKSDPAREVVVVDNASDDDSAAVAAAAGARVFVLPRDLFGYGRAINVGLELCRAEFVVLLSAHAWPVGSDWLEALVGAMCSDAAMAGAYCRQSPSRPLSRQERRRFQLFRSKPYTLTEVDLVEGAIRGIDPYELCRFSNSACILRREVALAIGFRDLPYAEDRAFAFDSLLTGHNIGYIPDAVVTYERPHTWRALYHVGRRAQIAKHLVREIATTGLARETQRSELTSRMLRLLIKPVATLSQIALSPIIDRNVGRRARRYAIASWGTTLGMLVGELNWRRHRNAIGCDTATLLAARNEVHPYAYCPSDPSTAAHLAAHGTQSEGADDQAASGGPIQ